MTILGVAASLLSKKATSEELAQVYIVPLKNGTKDDDPDIGVWALQFWPETVSITSSLEWASKNIVGGSHPLYQYMHGGERSISFTAEFARDMQGEIKKKSTVQSPGTVGRDKYNVDVAQALIWLESLKFPLYGGTGKPGFEPPPICYVVFPNSKFGRAVAGGVPSDVWQGVLTSFGPVTVDAWFPDGTIKHAVVPLTFAEVVQDPVTGIGFSDRKRMSTTNIGGKAYGVGVNNRTY